MYDRFTAGKWDEARAAQYRLTGLFDAVIGTGEFPDGFRLAAEARGVLPTAGPRLSGGLNDDGERERIRGVLDGLNLPPVR